MKRQAGKATFYAYIGAVLILVSFIPGLATFLSRSLLLHALWHFAIFAGAALMVYGLESLRSLARRYRRMTS
ncbi:hypothetical protein [Alicyclobacillus sp. SO9]|uniref:hypothetical protein n=1 Tax=Alicyclobacillus sp. SO9 TaxID=2665646 RepID=UPI0018E85CC0|nr:hypothetical protein [Alicyclobacillus sp. SO9]QQE78027.1 hypothetical protein GI364_19305 [Alicyclobacillus sp. SO9]